MNICLVNHSDYDGGAAQAAYRLHQGLRSLDQESVFLARVKLTADSSVETLNSSLFSDSWRAIEESSHAALGKRRTTLTNTLFSHQYPGINISQNPYVAGADIINLHWVALLLSPEDIEKILALGKHIVWTLHDQWPMTGGCHFSAGCQRFASDCAECPQLAPEIHDWPSAALHRKIHLWQNKERLTLVAPSRWLAEQAGRSRAFQGCRIEVIPNSLDTSIFNPGHRESARAAFGIPAGTHVFLFGCSYQNESRKGALELRRAIETALENPAFRSKAENGLVQMLAFGRPSRDLEGLGGFIRQCGIINSSEEMAALYASSDAMILPSLEDNLPNTMLESLACGTPVIGFRTGGIPEAIQYGINGLLCDTGDYRALGALMASHALANESSLASRENISEQASKAFALDQQAARYIELFQELTQKTPNELAPSVQTPNIVRPGHSYDASFINYMLKLQRLLDKSEQMTNALNAAAHDANARIYQLEEAKSTLALDVQRLLQEVASETQRANGLTRDLESLKNERLYRMAKRLQPQLQRLKRLIKIKGT